MTVLAPSGGRVTERTAHPYRMLLVAVSAMFMAQFDLFVVNIATSALRHDLRAGDAALELVVGGYAFAYAAGMVTGGRLGDRFGYRRMFLVGMAAFAVTSLLCGLAADPAQLVAGRLLQGLAGALMVPQVLSLITVGFPAEQRGRATAWYGFMSGAGAIAGQMLGGLLLQANVFGLGWRVIFLVNVPVGAVALAVAYRQLPRSAPRPSRFDPLGAVGITAALALALVPLTLGRQLHWPAWTWICLAATVPALALTLYWQRVLRARGGSPVLELSLFRNRRFAATLGAGVLFQLYFGSFMFTMSLMLQQGLGRSPTQAALIFFPQSILFSASALLGGRIVARYGRPAMRVGGVAVLAGLVLLIVLLAAGRPAPLALCAPLALIGLGNGLVLPPLIGAALATVPTGHAGAASGMVVTTQQFANSLGVAVVGALFFAFAAPTGGMLAAAAVHAGLVVAVLLLL